MVVRLFRYTWPLWLLQLVAGSLALAVYDWRAVALPLSCLYIALAFGSAFSLREESIRTGKRAPLLALGVALLWQLPALLGTINQVCEQWGLTPYDGNSDLFDFAMQTWQLALMPVLGLFPGKGADDLAGYYMGLTLAPVVMSLLYVSVAVWPSARGQVERLHRARADGEETKA